MDQNVKLVISILSKNQKDRCDKNSHKLTFLIKVFEAIIFIYLLIYSKGLLMTDPTKKIKNKHSVLSCTSSTAIKNRIV